MSRLTWHACGLLSGTRLGELPVNADVPIKRSLGGIEGVSLTLPVGDLPGVGDAAQPGSWEQWTQPGATMVVAERDTDRRIVWAGVVWSRAHTPDSLTVSCSSLESLFDRRFTGTRHFVVDEATYVARSLVAVACGDLGFITRTPDSEPSNPVQYLVEDTGDKKVGDALRELAGAVNGPEFACTAEWTDITRRTVRKVFTSTFRLGTTPPDEPAPPLLGFDSDQFSSWDYSEDYGDGKGATVVTATSDGGDSGLRKYSNDYVDTLALSLGMPKLYWRFAVNSNTIRLDQLNGHAAAVYALIHAGSATVNCSLEADIAPVLDVDYAIGDYVELVLHNARWVDGKRLVLRIYAAEVNPDGATTFTLYSDGTGA